MDGGDLVVIVLCSIVLETFNTATEHEKKAFRYGFEDFEMVGSRVG